MTPRRRDDDPEDMDVLGKRFRPAAQLLRFAWLIGGGLVALSAGLYALDHRLAVAAASELVEARVAPVERKLDDHLTEMRGKRELMDVYVRQQTEALGLLNRKLDALCRASARPQVCLGGE